MQVMGEVIQFGQYYVVDVGEGVVGQYGWDCYQQVQCGYDQCFVYGVGDFVDLYCVVG